MRKISVVVLLWIPGAIAQNQPWMPKPDCKVTPWLDGCPDAGKFKIDASKMINGSNAAPTTGSGQASAPQPPERTPAPARQVDWRRPISPKPMAADWPRWRFAPADASLVLGMKLQPLVESALFKDLFAGLAKASPVEEIWISLRTDSNGRPDAVMLLLGPALQPVAEDLRSKGVTVCFVDERSLLVGEWNAVNRALQRVLGSAAASSMDRRVRDLWTNYDVAFVINRALASGFFAMGGQGAFPASVSRVSMGMNLRDKIAFDVLIHTAKAADADLLAGRYGKGSPALGLPDGRGEQEIHRVPEGLSVRATLDAAQMPEALGRQLSAQFQPLAGMIRAKTEKAPAKGVVIQGLDDGPRVVP